MNRFAFGAFGFLLTAAYCPYIVGAADTPRWLVLAVFVPIALIMLFLRGDEIWVTWPHIIGFAFLLWAALSLLWTATPLDSIDALWPLALVGGCFALGSAIEDIEPLLIGAAFGIGISSALIVIEFATGWHLALGGAQVTRSLAGLFGNPDHAAEAAALVLVGLATFARKWSPVRFSLLVGLILPCLALTLARGAVLAAAVGIGTMAWQSDWPDRYSMFLARIAVITGAVGLGIVVLLLHPGVASIHARLAIWADMGPGLTVFGRGIGSFAGTFPLFARHVDITAVRDMFAHNDLLQIAYELGLPGIGLAGAFVLLILRSIDPLRFVFLALVVEACFEFPAHLPATAGFGLMLAGCACRDLPRVCFPSVLGRIPIS